jgi:hypothetical protein
MIRLKFSRSAWITERDGSRSGNERRKQVVPNAEPPVSPANLNQHSPNLRNVIMSEGVCVSVMFPAVILAVWRSWLVSSEASENPLKAGLLSSCWAAARGGEA